MASKMAKTSQNTVPIEAQQLQKRWKVKIFIETWMTSGPQRIDPVEGLYSKLTWCSLWSFFSRY